MREWARAWVTTVMLYFTIDECLDATNGGLWKTDLNWSKDAHELRKAAVASQEKTIFKRAKKHLKHLRIIDKKVCQLNLYPCVVVTCQDYR
jgi:hypothetical protein